MSVEQTLAERGKRYGDFTDHARLCQTLKHHMTAFSVTTSSGDSVSVRQPWYELSDVQKQALDVIADKIARILSGDPNYTDNWHDIQGYAKLVEDRLSALRLIDNCAVCGIDQSGNPDLHYVGCPNLTATPAFQAEVDATMGEVFGVDPDGWVEWDPDGWVEWGGEACPVPGQTKVDYVLRDGSRLTAQADQLEWSHYPNYDATDIVKYRRAK
jgi:hypothetical protein